MSKIREIREAIDKKPDKWEAEERSVKVQPQQTGELDMEELEARKGQLKESLDEFKSAIANAKRIANVKKAEIQALIEDLQARLVLGQAEDREAFEARKEITQRSIAALENAIDRELNAGIRSTDESLISAANKFIVAVIRLEVEMEFLTIQLRLNKDDDQVRFGNEMREPVADLDNRKGGLEANKQLSRDMSAPFESELPEGLRRSGRALKKLLN